jgi:hypothetical protein
MLAGRPYVLNQYSDIQEYTEKSATKKRKNKKVKSEKCNLYLGILGWFQNSMLILINFNMWKCF